MEKATGGFILVATFLMVFGFGFYVYRSAENRGWFAVKAHYFTYAKSGTGLQVGDKVKLTGFEAGQITEIDQMPPNHWNPDESVCVKFVLLNTSPGYIWTEGSKVKFADAGFLGKRELEVTKGTGGTGTYLHEPSRLVGINEVTNMPDFEKLSLGEELYSNTSAAKNNSKETGATGFVTNYIPILRVNSSLKANMEKLKALGKTNVWILESDKPAKNLVSIWNSAEHHYEPVTKKSIFFLTPEEAPPLNDRLQGIIAQGQAALPGILDLTNKVSSVLNQVSELTSNLNIVATEARTSMTNISIITANLKNPHGSLGEFIIPTNLNTSIEETLTTVRGTLSTAQGTLERLDTNLESLNMTLDHISAITGGLNTQVQSNTNILANISNLVVHSDEFVQGLKRFWLFRSTFSAKKKATAPVYPTLPNR